jgi:hypothetical protein
LGRFREFYSQELNTPPEYSRLERWGYQIQPSRGNLRRRGSYRGDCLAVIHDVTQAIALVDAIPAVRGKRGRPRRKPLRVQGDPGYDSQLVRNVLTARQITPEIAKRGTPHGSGLWKIRWVVEWAIPWLH